MDLRALDARGWRKGKIKERSPVSSSGDYVADGITN